MPETHPGIQLSAIAPHVVQSEIRSMSVECDRVGGINMAQGICDTAVPLPVVEGAIAAIHAGHNIYTRLDGIASLRSAIAAHLERSNGIVADPEREILVTNGATGAFYAASLALLNPGDEVLLFEPFYGYHWNTLRALRVEPVAVPLDAPDWSLDLDRVKQAITARTRAIVVNTPANPTGKVFTREDLDGLAALAIEHNLIVFTDEIYEHFVYDGREHVSLATLPGMRERTVTISGLSKTFSITGWRVGYLVANPEWSPAIGYFHDLVYVCSPAPLQHGAAAGLFDLQQSFYDQLAAEHQTKRDRVCAALNEAGLTPSVPGGAYYVLADATRIPGATAAEKARALLAATGVASVAGSAFFSSGGQNLLRFCFGKKDADLERACAALRGYR